MAKINTRDRNKNTGRKPNWEYRFEAAQVGGKRRSISKSGFRTKKEAQEAGAKALAEYSGEILPEVKLSKISFGDYLDLWMREYGAANFKFNTIRNYGYTIENYIKPYLSKYYLTKITPILLQDYLLDLNKHDLSSSFYYGILGILRGAFSYAIVPLGLIKTNPADFVTIPKTTRQKPSKEKETLSADEFNIIIKRYAPGNKYYLPLLLGWYNGLRVSEVFGLVWEDINFEKKTLSVQRQDEISSVDGDVVTVQCSLPKYNSTRIIDIGNELIALLKVERERQEKEIEYAGEEAYISYFDRHNIVQVKKKDAPDLSGKTICHPICIRPDGRLTNKLNMTWVCNSISLMLGKKVTFHSLRHSNTTLLFNDGVSLKTIGARLGHKNLSTTLNVYAHDTTEMKKSAVEKLERTLKPKK